GEVGRSLARSCQGNPGCNMSQSSSLAERLRQVLTTPSHGVLGLVDDLLAMSCEQAIRLDWQAGRCHVSIMESDAPDQIEVPVQKPAIRAALARLAALCNEQMPNSVSPYSGQGEVRVDADPAKLIRITFVNTPEEQRVELIPVQIEAAPRAGAQSLAAVV